MTLSVCVSVVVVEGAVVVHLFAVARKCLLSYIYCTSLCVPNKQTLITLPAISERTAEVSVWLDIAQAATICRNANLP